VTAKVHIHERGHGGDDKTNRRLTPSPIEPIPEGGKPKHARRLHLESLSLPKVHASQAIHIISPPPLPSPPHLSPHLLTYRLFVPLSPPLPAPLSLPPVHPSRPVPARTVVALPQYLPPCLDLPRLPPCCPPYQGSPLGTARKSSAYPCPIGRWRRPGAPCGPVPASRRGMGREGKACERDESGGKERGKAL
jgi:hypothetical protein